MLGRRSAFRRALGRPGTERDQPPAKTRAKRAREKKGGAYMVFGTRYRHRDCGIWNSGAFSLGSGLLLFGGGLWPLGHCKLVPASIPAPNPEGWPVRSEAVALPAVGRGSQRGDVVGDGDGEDEDGTAMGDRGRFPLLPWLDDLPSSTAAPHPPLLSAPGMCSVSGSWHPEQSVGP